MTPKEKAKELVEKYSFVEIAYHSSMFEVKQCALIAVDEILNDDCYIATYQDLIARKEYWQQVKQEIINL